MKIKSIQYLRGIAALLVVVAHGFEHQFAHPPLWLSRFGPFGVIMFFVISGFIMVLISGDGTFKRASFLHRRVIRVIPLYWLATAAVALIAIATPQLLRTTEFTWPHFLLSLLFIPHEDPSGAMSPLLKPGWTLNYEMFFYIVFAVFAGMTSELRVLVVTVLFAALIALGAALGAEGAIFTFYTQPILGAFCIGMAVGLATLHGKSLKGHPALQIAVAVVSTGCLGLAFGLDLRGSVLTTAGFAFGSAGLLLLGIALEDRIPASRLGLLIGDASYSIYLTHIFAIAAIVAVLRRITPVSVQTWIIVPLAILGGTILGLAVYRMVEKPLLARLQRPRRRPPAPPSALPVPADGTPPALMLDPVDRKG